MTRTSFTLDDLGRTLSEGALLSFVEHLPQDSELWRDTHPDEIQDSLWAGQELQSQLLAGIIDELRSLEWVVTSAFSKSKVPRPDRIERPGVKNKNQDYRTYGHDPIPINQFDKFWEEGK